MEKHLVLLLILFMFCISGCITQNTDNIKAQETDKNEINEIVQICIQACQTDIANLSEQSSSCLLDPIPQYPDWVCDVAHKPRIELDNLQENQCLAFRTGRAKHFIEVTPNCELIRVV
jgi:hypothetical protein